MSEHELALSLVDPLLDYIKIDAFSYGDRTLTYAGAIARFRVETSVRRLGRVLDAVERLLATSGWPEVAAAGVTAYVVSSSTGKPGDGWVEVWNMNPEDAREEARSYVRLLTLGTEDEE